MKTLFLNCLLLLLWISTAVAQRKDAEIHVRFTAQVLPDFLNEVQLVAGDTLGEPFTLPTRNFTPILQAPDRKFIVRSISSPDKGVPIQLPANGDNFVILLLKNSTGSLTPHIIGGSQPGFRPGDIYLHNLTSKKLVGAIGSRKFSVLPGKYEIVRPAGAKDGILDVAIGFTTERGIRPVTTSRWPEDPDHRSYLLFTENEDGSRVRFRSIEEFVPIPGKKE